MLDEGLRTRLRRTAETESPTLGDDARERIVATVRDRGPDLVRRGRIGTWTWAGIGGALAAAAAVAVYVQSSSSLVEPVTHSLAPTTQAVADKNSTAVVPEAVRACEEWPDRSAADVGFADRPGRRVLDLGRVAVATAPMSTDVYLQEATRCRTVIELREGSVAVHARDLGGGELVVLAADAEVRVRGTIFRVTRDAEAVAVDVVEGRVDVSRAQKNVQSVTGGRRLQLDAEMVAETDFGPLAQTELREAVEVELAEVAPLGSGAPVALEEQAEATESADQLLSRADALRRAGRLDEARALYRRAGSGSGPTAEAAWLALARMELAAGNPKGAARATHDRQKRFGGGSLGPEALWIAVRTHRQSGDTAAAKRAARDLVRRFPESAQADAARRFLSE